MTTTPRSWRRGHKPGDSESHRSLEDAGRTPSQSLQRERSPSRFRSRVSNLDKPSGPCARPSPSPGALPQALLALLFRGHPEAPSSGRS